MKKEREYTSVERIANINGELVPYYIASPDRDSPVNYDMFEYIGEGFIHSVDGIEQTCTDKHILHFWQKLHTEKWIDL